jgi:hypothetical protein
VTRYSKHARLLAGALALVVGLTLVAPPAFAASPAPDPRPIATAATAKVEAMPAATLAQAAQAAPAAVAETGDKPFFKTTKGAIALVLLAGGLGYMAYSMSNDRIKSPAK